ncbi:uncharacterized protein [Palaemon carinicauda]|uniref:uncharacterized protein n=1 Tax=Palaemon carinicauda TaxID=392227 RepID=UPI0035B648C7
MDTWLLLTAIFSSRVLAGPLPQNGNRNQELIGQHKAEGVEQLQNTPSNTFPGSFALQNEAQFSRNFAPGFPSQNGFAGRNNGGSSIEVVQVTHPSLTGGLSSLEELGISSSNSPTGRNNNFGSFGSNGGVGFSSAESGVNAQNFPLNNFHNPPFHPQSFGPHSFGNGGFTAPPFVGQGFSGLPIHARTTGFRGQNFVPSNNFNNGGFPNLGFSPGFNPTPFIGGFPFPNSFIPFGHGGGQFNPNFPNGNFGNGGLFPNVGPQNTRVILQSVPVVVGIVNETHARVTPHNQDFGQNSNLARFSLDSERQTSEIRPSHQNEDSRTNFPLDTVDFGQRVQESNLFSQISESSLSKRIDANNDPNKIQVSLDTVDSSPFQTEPLPFAEALIVTPSNDEFGEINRAGLTAHEESARSNLIRSEESTKFTELDKLARPIVNTDNSQAFSTSESPISNTGFGNLFDANSDSSKVDNLGILSSEFLSANTAEGSATTSIESQNALPILSALASFATIGTPPVENSHITETAFNSFNGESPQFRTSSLSEITAPQLITTPPPHSSTFQVINTTPISTIFEDNFNIPADSSLHTGISLVVDPVAVPNNENESVQLSTKGVMTGETGTSAGKMMHVGDHVSLTPEIVQTKVEPLIQLSSNQGKAIDPIETQEFPGAPGVITSIIDKTPTTKEHTNTSVRNCRCRSHAKKTASQTTTITEQIPVASPILETHEASIPIVPVFHSKFSATKPNTAFTITPSPLTATQTPSFDIISSDQQFDTINDQTLSNHDHISRIGVSTANKGVSGIVPAAKAKKFTPHAIILIPQHGNESVQQNFQHDGRPAQFTDSLSKRIGETAHHITEPATLDENIQNSQVLSSQMQGKNGIQVTSLGVSGPMEQVTTQIPILASTTSSALSFFDSQINERTSQQQISSTGAETFGSNQELQGSNTILLEQSAVIPLQSETLGVNSVGTNLPLSSSIPNNSFPQTKLHSLHITEATTTPSTEESQFLNSETSLTSSDQISTFNGFIPSVVNGNPSAPAEGDSLSDSVLTTKITIGQQVEPASHKLDTLHTSTIPEQIVTRTDSGISSSDATGLIKDPNFVLTIPLSFLSQNRGSAENVHIPTDATNVRNTDIAENIFNTFSFTTDPQEVLKILATQSSSSKGIGGFTQSLGLNDNAQESLQSGHLVQGTDTFEHQLSSVAKNFGSTGTNNQPPHEFTTKQETITPGQSGAVSVASPSGSLTFLPDTLSNISKALVLGVPLPARLLETQSGIQSEKATNDKNNDNRSKLGNTLKRDLPILT